MRSSLLSMTEEFWSGSRDYKLGVLNASFLKRWNN